MDRRFFQNWVEGVGFLFVLITVHVKVAEAFCGLGVWTAVLEPNKRPDSVWNSLCFRSWCKFHCYTGSVAPSSRWWGLFIQPIAQSSLWKLLTRISRLSSRIWSLFLKTEVSAECDSIHRFTGRLNSIHRRWQIKPKLYIWAKGRYQGQKCQIKSSISDVKRPFWWMPRPSWSFQTQQRLLITTRVCFLQFTLLSQKSSSIPLTAAGMAAAPRGNRRGRVFKCLLDVEWC